MLRRTPVRGVLPVLLASALALPAAASPALAATDGAEATAVPGRVSAAAGGCTVTGGTLTWGFKESFRSYVSGTIANGSWEASDGASYATPSFSWSGATGEVDAQGNGRIAFAGTVRFTGHGGLLDTRISSPVLVLGQGGAVLQLDTSGVSMDDALAGRADAVATHPAVPFAALAVDPAVFAGRAGEVSAADVPATVTAEGFAAFGSYEAGTPLDPVSVAVTLDCTAASSPAPAASSPSPSPVAEGAAASAGPSAAAADVEAGGPVWPVWLVAAVVLLGAAAAGAVLLTRRRRTGTAADGAGASGSGGPGRGGPGGGGPSDFGQDSEGQDGAGQDAEGPAGDGSRP